MQHYQHSKEMIELVIKYGSGIKSFKSAACGITHILWSMTPNLEISHGIEHASGWALYLETISAIFELDCWPNTWLNIA